ncbi:hypothetical protein B0H13DRAFT_1856188 [Mycena leptocephala]|nr:hypothetical protein B0H13DRAFT_1856188 [Mycena leptocephala]
MAVPLGVAKLRIPREVDHFMGKRCGTYMWADSIECPPTIQGISGYILGPSFSSIDLREWTEMDGGKDEPGASCERDLGITSCVYPYKWVEEQWPQFPLRVMPSLTALVAILGLSLLPKVSAQTLYFVSEDDPSKSIVRAESLAISDVGANLNDATTYIIVDAVSSVVDVEPSTTIVEVSDPTTYTVGQQRKCPGVVETCGFGANGLGTCAETLPIDAFPKETLVAAFTGSVVPYTLKSTPSAARHMTACIGPWLVLAVIVALFHIIFRISPGGYIGIWTMSIGLARPIQLRCAHVRAIRDCLRGCNKNDVVGEDELPVEGYQVEGLGPALKLGISPCHAPGSFIVVEDTAGDRGKLGRRHVSARDQNVIGTWDFGLRT